MVKEGEVSTEEAMEEMAKHIKGLEEAQKATKSLLETRWDDRMKIEEELRTEIASVKDALVELQEPPKEEEKAEPEPPAEEPPAEEPKKKPKKVRIIETLVP